MGGGGRGACGPGKIRNYLDTKERTSLPGQHTCWKNSQRGNVRAKARRGSWMAVLRMENRKHRSPGGQGCGWKLCCEIGGFQNSPGPSRDWPLFHPCTVCWGRGPLSSPLSCDWSALCPDCAPHGLLVTGLLSKMGLRLARACAHVLCSSSPDKAAVCGSRGSGGPSPPTVLFTRHWEEEGGMGFWAQNFLMGSLRGETGHGGHCSRPSWW